MRRVCAWCGVELTGDSEGPDATQPVSHGICRPCRDAHFKHFRSSNAQEFLDSIGVPVLVVDDDVCVLGANRQAEALLGMETPSLVGLKGGDVIHCVNAPLPGGCGSTVHCRTCTIRNTVRATYETGEACSNVAAYPDVEMSGAKKSMNLSISTEKVGNVVLLRIDDLRERAETVGTP